MAQENLRKLKTKRNLETNRKKETLLEKKLVNGDLSLEATEASRMPRKPMEKHKVKKWEI